MTTAFLDHIILLVPHTVLLNPPSWITDNFTLSPGGRHADGRTENKLILFADGTYLELIAFVDDEQSHRDGHWWGRKQNGLIDWSVSVPSTVLYEKYYPGVMERMRAELSTLPSRARRASRSANDEEEAAVEKTSAEVSAAPQITYTHPTPGGRKLSDGTEIRWNVSFPRLETTSTANTLPLPFYCYDSTKRELRVPISDASTKHPSGATTITRLVVLVHGDAVISTAGLISAAADSQVRTSSTAKTAIEAQVQLNLPLTKEKTVIQVVGPKSQLEIDTLEARGAGLAKIVFGTQGHNVKVPVIEADGVVIEFDTGI